MKDRWLDFIIKRFQCDRDQKFLLEQKVDSVAFCKQTKKDGKYILIRLTNKNGQRVIRLKVGMEEMLLDEPIEEDIVASPEDEKEEVEEDAVGE